MQSVHTLIKLAQLRWTGHVTRMPKKDFYGELQERTHSQGSQKKRCKDPFKASLKNFNSSTESLEQAAHMIDQSSVASSEKQQISMCEPGRKRKERKPRAKGSSSKALLSEFTSSTCNRQF